MSSEFMNYLIQIELKAFSLNANNSMVLRNNNLIKKFILCNRRREASHRASEKCP